VEAAGFEPASEGVPTAVSTGVASGLISPFNPPEAGDYRARLISFPLPRSASLGRSIPVLWHPWSGPPGADRADALLI